MKKILKYIFLVLLIILGAGWLYWQQHKKAIIKHGIQTAVYNGSDSIYRVRYDSSDIDEVSGSATFYNVDVSADTSRPRLLREDSLPATIFNIQAKKISIQGVDIPGLLSGHTISARIIALTEPQLEIIKTGHDTATLTKDDTIALYRQILGNYQSIRTDS